MGDIPVFLRDGRDDFILTIRRFHHDRDGHLAFARDRSHHLQPRTRGMKLGDDVLAVTFTGRNDQMLPGSLEDPDTIDFAIQRLHLGVFGCDENAVGPIEVFFPVLLAGINPDERAGASQIFFTHVEAGAVFIDLQTHRVADVALVVDIHQLRHVNLLPDVDGNLGGVQLVRVVIEIVAAAFGIHHTSIVAEGVELFPALVIHSDRKIELHCWVDNSEVEFSRPNRLIDGLGGALGGIEADIAVAFLWVGNEAPGDADGHMRRPKIGVRNEGRRCGRKLIRHAGAKETKRQQNAGTNGDEESVHDYYLFVVDVLFS